MVATICFSYFFFEKAKKDWNVRVDQTAERLSNTLLAWLEESYAPVSGLVALVENSKTVESNEFLNAFESTQSGRPPCCSTKRALFDLTVSAGGR